jgi:hypothetical protein
MRSLLGRDTSEAEEVEAPTGYISGAAAHGERRNARG